ncbi:MAG: isoprenylcysteine carboxylmethyltransferase family protein [Candidatus Omnitrophica bacterium]|nr:isoprenylcysteine carboxylmethyltransferase family protein [Candidatus Omnitrophota bacterium]
MKKRLKINGILIAIAAVLVIIFPKIFLQGRSINLSAWFIRICGIILIILGQLLRISARGYKAENSGNGSQLIQGGPYLVVRNPMYLGIFFIGAGLGLAVFQYWVICIFMVIFTIRYVILAFTEEKKLLGLFGDDYTRYCKKVPRFFPSFNSLFRYNIGEYLPLKSSWFYREIGSMVAVLVAALLFSAWGIIRI